MERSSKGSSVGTCGSRDFLTLPATCLRLPGRSTQLQGAIENPGDFAFVDHVCARPTLGSRQRRPRSGHPPGGTAMGSTKILMMAMLLAASGAAACSGTSDGASTGQIGLLAHGAQPPGVDAGRGSGRHDDMDDQDEHHRDAGKPGDDDQGGDNDDQGEDESRRADASHPGECQEEHGMDDDSRHADAGHLGQCTEGHGEGDEHRSDAGRENDDDGED